MIFWVERNARLFCFLVGLICTIPLVFVTPPFQVPDEHQHFYRAYQISEGQVIAGVENKVAGGLLPSSLIELSSDYLNSRAIHTDRPIVQRPWSSLIGDFARPLLPERREFIDFSGAAFYSPIPYIPQALAIALGRSFDAGPLILLYLARLANLMIAVSLLSFAVGRSPLGKTGLMAVAILPMSVYLFASVSPDAMVIGSALLFTALALEAYDNKRWTMNNLVVAITCAIVFCSIKVVYAPLILMTALSVFDRESRSSALCQQAVLIVIPIAVTAIWLHAVSGLIVPVNFGADTAAQAQHVIAHPFQFLEAVARGFLWNNFYFFSTIGLLGWLTLKLPAISYLLAVFSFLVSIFSVRHIRSARSSVTLAWWAMLAISSIGLIMLALYLYWTPVAGIAVTGVQGRYFLPVLPLLVTVIASTFSTGGRRISTPLSLVLVAGLGVAQALITVSSLSNAYWIN